MLGSGVQFFEFHLRFFYERWGRSANDSSEHTMTGCIVARNGEFFLRSKEHRRPIELLSPNDLTTHNGHEVTVTGTWANKGTVSEHEKQEEQNQSSTQKKGLRSLHNECQQNEQRSKRAQITKY